MSITEGLLPEFEHEMSNTRRALERVPEDKLDWRPHPKSGTLGWLAMHVAQLPGWTKETVEQDSLDIAPPGVPTQQPASPSSRKQILETFERCVGAARAALTKASDAHWMKPWTLLSGGKAIFTMPRIAVYRGFVMNHEIHHRAQLGVYLRLNNVPVPGLYGPSADEGSF